MDEQMTKSISLTENASPRGRTSLRVNVGLLDTLLMIEGEEVELDKTILESINDPLTHLVRNCVDHGIENPMDWEQAGKDKTGKIMLKVFHDADQVNIIISDDGRGLN